MSVEDNPEHVVGLALVPVGGAPQVGHARHVRILPPAVDLHRKLVAKIVAVQVVDDGHAIVGRVVDAREAGQPVEVQARIAAEELGHLAPVGCLDVDARVLVVGKSSNDSPAEAFGEDFDNLAWGHEVTPVTAGI